MQTDIMIGEKIRKIRVDKGIAQEFIADALKISQSAYSRIESGKTKPDFIKIQVIADIFGMTTAEIINYEMFAHYETSLKNHEMRIIALEDSVKALLLKNNTNQ